VDATKTSLDFFEDAVRGARLLKVAAEPRLLEPLAHASGEARQRLVQMERRAIAALSGADWQEEP
jgi:hypothetical protein